MKLKKFLLTPGTEYFLAVFIPVLLITGLYNVQDLIGYPTVSLVLLFFILLLPLLGFSTGPIIVSALISALGWNYYFIPPHFTFQIARPEDIMMNCLFFIVAVVTGLLTSRLKTQESFIVLRESHTNALYNLVRQLSQATTLEQVNDVSIKNIKSVFDLHSILLLLSEDQKTLKQITSSSSIEKIDLVVAEWSVANKEEAGRGTKNLPYVDELYIPLQGTREILGCIGVKIPDHRTLSKDEKEFLLTFIAQIASAVERELLNEIAKKNYLMTESEKLYKNLFNSISHELRTPITTIMSAASTIQDDALAAKKEVRDTLSEEIETAAERLNRLVENLLDMTRLESGQLKPRKTWNDINDLLNSVLKRIKSDIGKHRINTLVEMENPLFLFDFGLLEQAFINIIHNCLVYTPDNAIIDISITEQDKSCVIKIKDNGQGFPQEALAHLFKKFFRAPGSKTGGTGLGLSIAKGFIEAHGGTITACNVKPHGAQFTITLPINREDGTTAKDTDNR